MPGGAPPLTPFADPLGAQRGWRFRVTGRRGRPGVALEAGTRQHDGSRFIAARLRVGDHVGFWAWVDDWWGQAAFCYAAHCAPAGIVPAITARQAADQPDWLRRFHAALAASPRSPLYDGDWWIGAGEDWPLRRPKALADAVRGTAGAAWFSDFEDRVIATRLVPHDDRRVDFWRKQLAAGARPPVLLLSLSLLEGFAILDGHARLAAADGAPLPVIILAPFHERRYPPNEAAQRGVVAQANQIDWAAATPAGVDAYNRALVRAFADPVDPCFRIRAWPLRGGWAQWQAEIEARVAALPAAEAEAARHLMVPWGDARVSISD